MWSEIDFVKGKLDAIQYQMIHGELLPFIIKTEDKKTKFQQDNAPIHTATTTKR